MNQVTKLANFINKSECWEMLGYPEYFVLLSKDKKTIITIFNKELDRVRKITKDEIEISVTYKAGAKDQFRILGFGNFILRLANSKKVS